MTVMTAQLTETTSKIILHIKPLALQDMVRISQKLKGIVEAMNIPDAIAEADIGMMSNKQWDFIYMGIPTYQLQSIRSYIIHELVSLF